MNIASAMPRLKGYRFPREIVAYAVWVYHRFALSMADVEDLLAVRGVVVSRETIRKWLNRFGVHFAGCIRRDRPAAVGKWHLDEVVIPINGRNCWLWRAVDASGDMLDILVSGYLVSTGRFSLVLVATAGALGCNIGSTLAYLVGVFGGRPLVDR